MSAPKVSRTEVAGAAVLTIEEHSLPVVRFVVALRRGSAFDRQGRSGSTRAMMELMLRGTTHRDREVWGLAIEELGSSLNAVPGSEAAYFRGVSLKKNLTATLELVAEALSAPRFDPEEHEALIAELTAALANDRDDDDTVAELFLRRAVYKGHPLERSPIGEAPDVAKLTAAGLKELHAERLVSSNLVIAFAGDITPAEAEQAAHTIADKLPRGVREPSISEALPPLPVNRGLTIVLADKPDRAQVQLRVAHAGLAGNHADTLALWLGIVAFGGTFTSPLTQEVRDVRGWSYVAHADFSRRAALPSPIVLRSVPPKDHAVDCLALELDLLGALAQGSLDRTVLERARSYVLGRYPFEVATAADMLNPVLRCELLGESTDEIFNAPKLIEKLSEADVLAALKKHLSRDVVVTMVATAKEIEDSLRARFSQAAIEVVDFRSELPSTL